MSLVPYVHVDVDLSDAVPGTVVEPGEEERHHLLRVLRLGDGDEVEVSDGAGTSGLARVEDGAIVVTGAVRHTPVPRPELWVAQALPKGRKLDEVVRQVTELGVDGILAVAADHSVTRLDAEKGARNRSRWAAIARAACEQARRPRRPEVFGPIGLEELLERPGVLIVTDPGARSLPAVLGELTQPDRVTLVVGPEGGWSVRERDRFHEAGVPTAGLGPTVLRTEHAAAAAVAVGAALLGRWA